MLARFGHSPACLSVSATPFCTLFMCWFQTHCRLTDAGTLAIEFLFVLGIRRNSFAFFPSGELTGTLLKAFSDSCRGGHLPKPTQSCSPNDRCGGNAIAYVTKMWVEVESS